jgi:arylsulfatase A
MPGNRKISRREFLKGSLVIGGALLAGALGYRGTVRRRQRDYDPSRSENLLEGIQPASDPQALPNIILIFTDDLGYGDLGSYGSKAINTPNLDHMTAEGVRLTNFYSTAPLCSPARAGLLTGRYPIRTMVTGPLYPSTSPMNILMNVAGFYTYGVTGIPEDEVLLPEILRRRGYVTALLGKWHLGDHSPHLPNENGFDLFYGAFYSNGMSPYRIYRNRQIEIDEPVDQNLLTQNLTREAIKFIQDHQEEPFFLYLAHPMPHEPIHASQEFRGRSEAGLYGDAVEEIDWSVGEILKTLADNGLDEKTLVFFTSDNGPWWQGNPGFTRGRKNLPFEGGFRVPLIARWPGVIPPAGFSEEVSMSFDLFSTCLQVAGISPPKDRVIDGVSILPLLKGEAQRPHETLYFYKGNALVGVRHGKWKYLRRHMTDNGGYASLSQGPFLFNLELDPNESYSLIESMPGKAQELARMLDEFETSIEANTRGWY